MKCDRAFSESGNLRTHQKVHVSYSLKSLIFKMQEEDGNSSLGKRSRCRKTNSQFTTPAVSPCSISRRILKINQKAGLKTLNPSGVRYKNPRTTHSGFGPIPEDDDENPKIIFDSDNRDGECSPISPLRLKL
jgi:hypothetical protein